MTHGEIERWALRVIEQVRHGQPNEDARVELKSAWPQDAYRAARQIAALANPAGGGPVLWLIGVDQSGAVPGADHKELSSWYAQVESHFDEIAPGVTDVNVPVDGRTVVALLFDTGRRPFVVITRDAGHVQREVPWRGATSTRSAKRSELLRLLDDVPRPPAWEPMNGTLTVGRNERPRMKGNNNLWLLALKLYVEPATAERIIVPFHRCAGRLSFPDFGSTPRLRNIRLAPYDPQSASVKGSNSDLVIDGAGMVRLESLAESHYAGLLPHTPAHLSIDLSAAGGGHPVTVQAVFNFNEDNSRWEFGDLTEESAGVFFGSKQRAAGVKSESNSGGGTPKPRAGGPGEHKLVAEVDTDQSQVGCDYLPQALRFSEREPDVPLKMDLYVLRVNLKIRFENHDVHPIPFKQITVSLLRKARSGAERIIPVFRSFMEMYEGDAMQKFSPEGMEVRGRRITPYYWIQSALEVPARYGKRLNRNCFLRVTTEALGQPPYHVDLDVNWANTLGGYASVRDRVG
jgi:hypothetical protein